MSLETLGRLPPPQRVASVSWHVKDDMWRSTPRTDKHHARLGDEAHELAIAYDICWACELMLSMVKVIKLHSVWRLGRGRATSSHLSGHRSVNWQVAEMIRGWRSNNRSVQQTMDAEPRTTPNIRGHGKTWLVFSRDQMSHDNQKLETWGFAPLPCRAVLGMDTKTTHWWQTSNVVGIGF